MPLFFSKKSRLEYWHLRRLKFCLDNPAAIVSEELFMGEYYIQILRNDRPYFMFFESSQDRNEYLERLKKINVNILGAGLEFHPSYGERFENPSINRWDFDPVQLTMMYWQGEDGLWYANLKEHPSLIVKTTKFDELEDMMQIAYKRMKGGDNVPDGCKIKTITVW